MLNYTVNTIFVYSHTGIEIGKYSQLPHHHNKIRSHGVFHVFETTIFSLFDGNSSHRNKLNSQCSDEVANIFGTDYGFMAKMLATPLLDFKLILRRKSKQVLEKPQQPSKSQHFSQQNSIQSIHLKTISILLENLP